MRKLLIYLVFPRSGLQSFMFDGEEVAKQFASTCGENAEVTTRELLIFDDVQEAISRFNSDLKQEALKSSLHLSKRFLA